MKRNMISRVIFPALFLMTLTWIGCSDYPVDEDGLLITSRSECYVSNFELLGVDFQTVRSKAAEIDTTECTISAEVFYGTDLKNVYPQLTLVTDAKLEPKITGKTDFSALIKQYTVVSGNREVRKTYTINITIQPKP
jgi:hypothetical protein